MCCSYGLYKNFILVEVLHLILDVLGELIELFYCQLYKLHPDDEFVDFSGTNAVLKIYY